MWGLQSLKELINVHPVFVHFPIALLLTSFACYLLGSVTRNQNLLAAGKWTLYFGTLGAALAVWTGWQAARSVSHGGETHDLMILHQYFGFAVLGLGLLLSGWVFFSKALVPAKGRFLFLAGLAVLGLVLIQGADLGARMVFFHGIGLGRKRMMTETVELAGHDHGGHTH